METTGVFDNKLEQVPGGAGIPQLVPFLNVYKPEAHGTQCSPE